MFRRWLLWPLLAAVIGLGVGGGIVWVIDHPIQKQHISDTATPPDAEGDKNKPAKPFWKAFSEIWDRTWDDPVAFYTFVLAIFTALLAIVASAQILFLIRADKTARISAEAAKESAKAAQASADAIQLTERPYIFIWGVTGSDPRIEFSSSDGSGPRTFLQEEVYFTYSVSNRGKLAAVIENVSIACGYEYRGMYPPLIIMGDHYLLQVPILSSEQDKEHIPHRRPWRDLSPEQVSPGLKDGLVFRVVIKYRGPITRGHETSQCWRYVRSLNGFTEVTDEQYTYSY